MVSGLSSGNAHINFEMIDGSFYNGSDFVGAVPFFGITLNARKHT